jgi:DNA primase
VEGYLDVIALHQAGFENVISPMGTALTEDQMRLLKKFTRRIVLALDPDTAGQKAVLRGLEAARSAMDKEGELGFDARGLLRNEARLQADLRVASMPDDLDPDEIVGRDKDEWARLIENAKPIVTHVMETLAAGQNLNEPKVKNQIAAQVLPLIEDLPNPLERDTYRQALSRLLRVDERSLMGMQTQGPQVRRPRGVPKSQARESAPAPMTVSPGKLVEGYVVGVLFRKPELLYRLDRSLQELSLAPLDTQDFEYTDHKLLFGYIRESVEQDKAEHHTFVVEALPESLQGLSRDLLAQRVNTETLDEKLLEELLRAIIKLRRTVAGENLNQLRFLQAEAQEDDDSRASFYQDVVLQHTRLLRDLDQARRRMLQKRLE